MNGNKGKLLAFLLRHDTEYKFEKGGWRTVENLVTEHGFTLPLLEDIVKEDSKGRFEFNKDHDRIRARQGHSVSVDVDLEEKQPPEILYHGTSSKYLGSIKRTGIDPRTRLYVHLSSDIETARDVGARHKGGETIILEIKAGDMYRDGQKFYLSRNNVWMTKYVDFNRYGKIYKETPGKGKKKN